jgi:hypothetical protein
VSPTILRAEGYRFFFTSHDAGEPPHVHVQSSGKVAKIWLAPVSLADAGGYSPVEVRRAVRLAEEHRAELLRAWDDFFRQ